MSDKPKSVKTCLAITKEDREYINKRIRDGGYFSIAQFIREATREKIRREKQEKILKD